MPTCEGNFLSVWKEKLVREYKMDVSTICCEWNRCNGPNAGTSGLKGPEIHFILPLATAVVKVLSAGTMIKATSGGDALVL